MEQRSQYSDCATGYTVRGLNPAAEIFLFSKMSRPTLGPPPQPAIPWPPKFSTGSKCGRSVKLTVRLHLAPSLRTSGSTSLPPTCSHRVDTVFIFIYLLMAPFGDGVNTSECTTSNVRRKTNYFKRNRRQRSSPHFRYKDIILCDKFSWTLPVGSLIVYTVAAEWPENACVEIAAGSGKRYLAYRIMTLYFRRIFLLAWRKKKS